MMSDDPEREVARRDRFGQRSVYWAESEGSLLVASSLLAVGRRLGPEASWDREAAALALLGALPPGRSLLRGVARLPPGAALRVADSRPLVVPAPEAPPVATPPGATPAAELRRRLASAVASRSGDDPAVALSGGLDSAALLALLASGGRTPRAWSLVDDAASPEEREAARNLAERFGAQQLLVQVRAEELPAHTEAAVRAIEEPIWNGRAVARWLFLGGLRAAGEHSLLSGVGADELLCGHPAGLRTQAEREALERALARCLLPGFPDPASPGVGGSLAERRRHALSHTLPASTLPPDARSAGSVGVELRLPFLDPEVTDFALALPESELVRGDVGKRVLREAMRDLLPASVVDAPKRPGLAPVRPAPAARRAWRELYGDWLTPTRVQDALPADPQAVAALLADRDRSGPGGASAETADAVLLRLLSLVILQRAASGS
jgi:asparagine synthase (glutamine-hydrolysing)